MRGKERTLKRSLLASHILVSLVPLALIALVMLLSLIRSVRSDALVKIGMLAQGTKGQIQLFLDQPADVLRNINDLIEPGMSAARIGRILDIQADGYRFFEAVYLLNEKGDVVGAGLPRERRHYRQELLGMNLGHKKEFARVLQSGRSQWSDTFLSLSSGKISLTLYAPAGGLVIAADIRLSALAQMIARLSRDNVVTMVIDRNGAIIFHPDADLLGKSVTIDNSLVRAALQGREASGEFTFMGKRHIGSSGIIEPAGWISLIAEPRERQNERLAVPLLIFAGGLGGAALISVLLALSRAETLSRPLTVMTQVSSVIAGGRYSAPLPSSRFAELEQLADSISHMADSIRKRENELVVNERKYRELVENTSNLVLRLDRYLVILYVNHTIAQLCGMKAEEALGKDLSHFLVEEDWQRMRQEVALWAGRQNASDNAEVRLRHMDGSVRNLLFTVNLHYASSGNLEDVNIIGHDITVRYDIERQQREIEKQRQQHQKMELLGLMAGGVAHDLNNILAGIINYPELLLLKLDGDDPQRPLLEAMKKSGERAAAVVADLLTVSRNSASVHAVVDINALLAGYCASPEFIRLRHVHAGVAFRFEPQPDLPACRCSRSHIEKTVMNLVTNAFEASRSGGLVTVKSAKVSAREIEERDLDLAARDHVAIMVQDGGDGIAKEDIEHIFEPFYTKKTMGRSGTGLGLAVAWSSVREHGGTITVDSGGEGTIFTVYLPASTQRPAAPEEENIAAYRGRGEHILVVDDDEHLRQIGRDMLLFLGYRVSTAASGEEAVAIVRRDKIDLVLLDMLMEPGINGKETYERICEAAPGQRALIASGYSESQEVESVIRMGAGGYIRKPYSLTDLGRSVAEVLQAG